MRAPIFGNVVAVLGKRKLCVHFDDEKEEEMHSNNLKSHNQVEALPIKDALVIGNLWIGGDMRG
jgi:hypothetical protein